MPGAVRRAVIDIGTNSIKLLVADVLGHTVEPIWEGSRQTRLGQGFFETHRLQPEAIARTAAEVGELAGTAKEQGAETIRVFATSAARDAANPEELIQAVRETAGFEMEIISGEQEAEWAFRGATTDPKLATEPLLLLDLGGGSTEFILGEGDHKHFQHSFPLGTVRLMERIPHSDPPRREERLACLEWVREFIVRQVQPEVLAALRRERDLRPGSRLLMVGTGGTATILGRMQLRLDSYDRAKLESVRLSQEDLRRWVNQLWGMGLEERRQTPGLPANRADVILTGTVIYQVIMEQLGFEEMRVSTRGLRFAAVLEG